MGRFVCLIGRTTFCTGTVCGTALRWMLGTQLAIAAYVLIYKVKRSSISCFFDNLIFPNWSAWTNSLLVPSLLLLQDES
jgi:hypothetical protein